MGHTIQPYRKEQNIEEGGILHTWNNTLLLSNTTHKPNASIQYAPPPHGKLLHGNFI